MTGQDSMVKLVVNFNHVQKRPVLRRMHEKTENLLSNLWRTNRISVSYSVIRLAALSYEHTIYGNGLFTSSCETRREREREDHAQQAAPSFAAGQNSVEHADWWHVAP